MLPIDPLEGYNDAVLYWTIDTDPLTGEPIAVPVRSENIKGKVEKRYTRRSDLPNLHNDPEFERAVVARMPGAG